MIGLVSLSWFRSLAGYLNACYPDFTRPGDLLVTRAARRSVLVTVRRAGEDEWLSAASLAAEQGKKNSSNMPDTQDV